jgi:hypothetical protein
VGTHVDRHVDDRDRQIGAVVEIVAAQEILVGFALARVLRDDQTRRSLPSLRSICRPSPFSRRPNRKKSCVNSPGVLHGAPPGLRNRRWRPNLQ